MTRRTRLIYPSTAHARAIHGASRNGLINFGPSWGWLLLALLLLCAAVGGLR